MKNDGTYFLIVKRLDGSIDKVYPDMVYPFVWEGIEFFVHRCLNLFPDVGNLEYSKAFWQVSDKECGCSLLIEGATVIYNAQREAVKKLDTLGVDKMKERIKEMQALLVGII